MTASNHLLPWDISGCVFTGHTLTQTFQVTVKYYFERLPTTTNPDLIVLTKVPAPHDPVVLEIYSRAMWTLPIAVMVKENPLGEWFEDVLNAVSSVLPTIGTALSSFFPPAGVIGSGLGGIAKAIAENNKRERVDDQKNRNLTQLPALTNTVTKTPSVNQPRKKKAKKKKAGTIASQADLNKALAALKNFQ